MKKIAEVIKNILKKEAKKIKKDVLWFKFAKKTKKGHWRFLVNKEIQWKKLEEIATKLSKKYKKYTTGKIVDIISEIVNR